MSSPCKNPDFEYKLGNTIESPGRPALTMPLLAAGDSSRGATPALLAAAGRPEGASLVMKTRRGTPLGRSQPPAKRMRVLAPKTTPAPAPADQPEPPPPRGYALADLDHVFFLKITHLPRGLRRPLASTAPLVEFLADLALPMIPRRQHRARTPKNKYMLQEDSEKVVSKEMIQKFVDDEVQRRFALLHDVFKIGMDAADAEQLADQHILAFFEGKTLKLERYLLYQVHSNFINGYAKATREHWLTAVCRFAEKCISKGRRMLAHPFNEVCSLVKEIIDDLLDAPKGCKDPSAQLAHYRQGIGKLTLVQLGLPSGCRVNTLAEGVPKTEWQNVVNYVRSATLKERSRPAAIPVAQRASKLTISEAEAREVYAAMLISISVITSRHPDLQSLTRGHLTLNLLLALGCRGQDLTLIKFSGFTISHVEHHSSAEGPITLFNLISAGARKLHQDGKSNAKAVLQAADPLMDPAGALGLYLTA
ncbi:hypothetical protein Ndes2526A_g07681 [Nannochloris sp. 'desiccata']|nr:hypothetical protein KSW81_002442 [Chlorella desiccata (nom. nud.)]